MNLLKLRVIFAEDRDMAETQGRGIFGLTPGLASALRVSSSYVVIDVSDCTCLDVATRPFSYKV